MDISSIEFIGLKAKPRPEYNEIFDTGNKLIDGYSNSRDADQRLCHLESKTPWSSNSKDPRECLLPSKFLHPCFQRIGFYSSGLESVSAKGIFEAVAAGNFSLPILSILTSFRCHQDKQ